jgi:hypothetical protein
MQGRQVEHTNEAVRTSPPTANEVGRRVRQTALGLVVRLYRERDQRA